MLLHKGFDEPIFYFFIFKSDFEFIKSWLDLIAGEYSNKKCIPLRFYETT